MDELTDEILNDVFGRFCGRCSNDKTCTKPEHNRGCNDRVVALKYKCKTCYILANCKVAWKTPLPCLNFKDFPEGIYNNDEMTSIEPRIGEPEEHALHRKYMKDLFIVRDAIRVKHPEGKEFVEGTMDCPICGGRRTYMISDHVNGHIHSSCSGKNCVNWVE